jgi:hypothetical protein
VTLAVEAPELDLGIDEGVVELVESAEVDQVEHSATRP